MTTPMPTAIPTAEFAQSVAMILTEFIDGCAGDHVYFSSGPQAGGVAGAVRRIPGRLAFDGVGSAEPHTPAGIVSHLLYSSDLFVRGLRGDHSGYATADWDASWNVPPEIAQRAASEPDQAWAELAEQMIGRVEDARDALATCEEFHESLTRTGTMGHACHYAYHLAQLTRLAGLAENAAG